jgi:hypothetical protein
MERTRDDIKIQISQILEEHKIKDLKAFIKKKNSFNNCNMYLTYFFHIVQAAGIFTSTLATGCHIEDLIWVGIGLNVFASLIKAFQDSNNNFSKKFSEEILNIKSEYLHEEYENDKIEDDTGLVNKKCEIKHEVKHEVKNEAVIKRENKEHEIILKPEIKEERSKGIVKTDIKHEGVVNKLDDLTTPLLKK